MYDVRCYSTISLTHLLDETDPSLCPAPLFTARLELCEPEVIFRPSLERKMAGNLYDIWSSLLEDIYTMADLLPRLAHSGQTYLTIVRNHRELKKLKKTLIERVERTIASANETKNNYLQYSYLWLESKSDYMDNFLTYARQLDDNDIQKLQAGEKIKQVKPKLADFQREINHFESIYEDIKKLDKSLEFSSWFKVDVNPLKTTLQMCVKKWSYLFKKHLIDMVVTSLAELDNFLEEAEIGLQSQISEGDYDGLVKMMGFIKAVKNRQSKYDHLFGEMSKIISLLQNFNVLIPEKSLQQLAVLPDKWVTVKQLSSVSKHLISTLTNIEVSKLTLKIECYEKRQKNFRMNFLSLELFSYSCRNYYSLLNRTNREIATMEMEIKSLQSECDLFDIQQPSLKLISQSREDLK